MFSVLRFSGFKDSRHLLDVGLRINELRPGLFEGPDRVENRVSLSISDVAEWETQCQLIDTMVGDLRPLLQDLANEHLKIEVDLAIWPEDYFGRFMTNFTMNLQILKVLAEADVELNFTVYSWLDRE